MVRASVLGGARPFSISYRARDEGEVAWCWAAYGEGLKNSKVLTKKLLEIVLMQSPPFPKQMSLLKEVRSSHEKKGAEILLGHLAGVMEFDKFRQCATMQYRPSLHE